MEPAMANHGPLLDADIRAIKRARRVQPAREATEGDLLQFPGLADLVRRQGAMEHFLLGLRDEFTACIASGRAEAWLAAATATLSLAAKNAAPTIYERGPVPEGEE